MEFKHGSQSDFHFLKKSQLLSYNSAFTDNYLLLSNVNAVLLNDDSREHFV